MKQNILVFSIALNGYQWLYKDCLASHRHYATINGYRYQAVTRPFITSLGVECCWLKLTLLQEALKAGYDTVLFVDADAYIDPRAPKIETALRPEKYLYLARSYSGRYNSGVLLVQNHSEVQLWLDKVVEGRYQNVLEANSVGWGENGHVIQHTKGCHFVCTLNRRWNNTYDPELNDYIRHFSFGPLRKDKWLNLSHKILSRVTRLFLRIHSYLQSTGLAKPKENHLSQLTDVVLRHYQLFCRL